MEKNGVSDRIKVLLIDEEEGMPYLIRRLLGRNYKISAVKCGKQGMEIGASLCPDLILMDIRQKDMDGTDLIRWFREWTECPIIVASEQGGNPDKVNALYAGADDYIVKPFHEQELKARIYTALRRRISCGQGHCYQAGELKMDFMQRRITLSGAEIHFSPVEYRILECLALNAGSVVTYQMLMEKIWGPYTECDSRVLRVNMTNIRKKIEQTPMKPEYIITIPKVGYRLTDGGLAAVSGDPFSENRNHICHR